MGGQDPSNFDTVEFVTIATLGNGTDYGDITVATATGGCCSNPVRGLYAGGRTTGDSINTGYYITIASSGNTTVFGDLTVARELLTACSSSTRGVFAGGYSPDAASDTLTNHIDYVQMMSLGNAVDFGDLVDDFTRFTATSNAHGGL